MADPLALRKAFGAFATGVTVITVGGPLPHGMTANSFTAVSLDPPLLLVCVQRDAVMHRRLADHRHFGVSVLAAHQEDVARYFADRRRPLGREEFAGVDWLPGPTTGSPLIAGALVHFECELRQAYDGGDHTIFLGGLLSMDRRLDDDVLLFLSGRFHQINQERSDVTT
ncbi:flavin reductase family protein [Micromonospora sp. WMMD1082]|uniref:flavin reductase family protein n=1 Tax=Micromonospora sp. WMMD1082 TaxID=3016104 RepID=UPI0024173BCA|nr:flavin reductase family protein [Micromonospora sp. WMMD1082]MDG4793434.1 flavin reductase family protein [Micromonospora sp. WMMD1082]